MLDTIIKIGEVFKSSDEKHRYHKFIRSLKRIKDENLPKVIQIPVSENGNLLIDKISDINDQNLIRNNLFYWDFKTSDSDTVAKYAFGDIYYVFNEKKKKEFGNYKISKNAFETGGKFIAALKNERIQSFYKSFGENKTFIDELCNQHKNLFIHFDFNNNHWYEGDTLEIINELLIKEFTKPADLTTDSMETKFVLEKTIYKTLCSGDEKNDKQFPQFKDENRHKSKVFSMDEFESFLYALEYSKTESLSPYFLNHSKANEKIKIIILPRIINDKLTPEDLITFQTSRESVFKTYRQNKNIDTLLAVFSEDINNEIQSFDTIFTRTGGRTESDLIEISGVDRSFIEGLKVRILKITEDYSEHLKSSPPFIINALFNIYSNDTSEQKGYQKHLVNTLSKILTGNYISDPLLLPAAINKIESIIRAAETGHNYKAVTVLTSFNFLTLIQFTETEGENLMKLHDSPSYKMGKELGIMAQPLNKKIASFKRNFAGNLTRRISCLADVVAFKVFLDEKLTIHNVMYPSAREASVNLANLLAEHDGRYDKNECAFGFFESYLYYSGKEAEDEIPSEEENQESSDDSNEDTLDEE
ncbi:MAG: hypothetical protein L6Q47_05110 [Ignavibacteriaceae bacterium]|nr:hypothetical protein [Ignavibacteriaceae bacterium]